MSSNRFTKPDLKKRISESVNFSIIVFGLVIVIFLVGVSMLSNSSARDDRAILEKAIDHDIVHCYAVEGFYPPSLDYIESNYGLSYDKARFLIDYEYVGTNVMPDVMIIERNSK